MNKGSLVVVSGFSGAGKGTLMKNLLAKYDNYALSISCTTRKPREGELDGREYFFKTKEEFEEMIKNDELVEYAQYVDNYYGTPKEFVWSQLDAGKDVLLEIEIQGALKIKEKFPDAVLVFITTPSGEELKSRLIGRGTEAPEVVKKRLERAVQESEGVEAYDYILINDDIDTCTEKLHNLIRAQHERAAQHIDIIESVRKDLRRIEDVTANI
ncbi:guanylate kinase [Oribacterium sp. KHPX15]|uniref:guanylate kinase n=1 Tax=Oribacterium sp. KHPX15 TaxID=1855342 RepID=UPI00089AA2C9|nr:guanylate kinase [Oribacterium sp. KHPX15]SDZ98894.1 guanylate kinase [Oribacterium sp. KHPX15]